MPAVGREEILFPSSSFEPDSSKMYLLLWQQLIQD